MQIETLTLTAAAAALGSGRIGAEEYARALIERAAQWRHVNAIVAADPERLLEAARAADRARANGQSLGVLHGVPLVVKDNIDTAGYPTTACTPALRENRPVVDAPVWARLRAQGALLAGKTNMHELAFGITNNGGAFGACRNPYDPMRVPGGSSGGTGAAVGARLAPGGLGSDTGGSSRIPAAFCGIAGLRPSLGRYPGAGIVPISTTRDTAGPMAVTVADVALLDAVISGAPSAFVPRDLRGVRFGVARKYFYSDMEPAVATLIETVFVELQAAGAELVAVDLPDLEALNAAVSFVIAGYEAPRALAAYLDAARSHVTVADVVAGIVTPGVREIYDGLLGPMAVTEGAYRDAIGNGRPRLQRAYADGFARYRIEALVAPTVHVTPPPIGADETFELNGAQVPTFFTVIRNCEPASNAGIPSVSVPIGLAANGLPVGLLFDGPFGRDRELLALAAGHEALRAPVPLPAPG
jgi:mandelamide amidase